MAKAEKKTRGDLSRDEAHLGRALELKQKSSAQLRDIGLPAAISDPELRARVDGDAEYYLKWLSPDVFKWPFSDDQRLSIAQMDAVIERGGLQAVADPRGTGKTQRAIRMAIRAIVLGRKKFVCVVAATEKKARAIIRAIKTILCYNRQLQELYPAELHGFAELKGNGRKAAGQLCDGVETAISLGADQIIFPTIPGSKCSGAIISSCGITGDIRGQFHTRQDGSVIRPDLVLLDDPQTKESAESPEQTQTRMETIEGDILGLAGPDTSIACMVLCTVIAANDLSERMLAAPKWHGRRTKTIYQWPKNLKAWDEYFEDYEEAIRCKEPERINENYRRRREELDEGCILAWDQRIESGDVSPIQTAMHIWHRVGPHAFAFEFQNESPADVGGRNIPSPRAVVTKLINLDRGIVPIWATKLTCFIDVHLDLLYWAVVAWADDFTGHLVDVGAFPEQQRTYFTLGDASPTLREKSGSSQPQGAIRWGLDVLTEQLLGTGWKVEGDTKSLMYVGKCGVDEGYNMAVVHEFIKRSKHGGILIPCKGLGIKAGSLPMDEWKPDKKIEQLGDHWTRKLNNKTGVRFGKIDTYHWKTFICERIAAVIGEKGCFTVFGHRPETHKMLLDHATSEKCIATYRHDKRLIWEWQDPVAQQDNHLWDCLANNGPLASMLGCSLDNTVSMAHAEPKRRDVVIPKHLQRRKGA